MCYSNIYEEKNRHLDRNAYYESAIQTEKIELTVNNFERWQSMKIYVLSNERSLYDTLKDIIYDHIGVVADPFSASADLLSATMDEPADMVFIDTSNGGEIP